MKRKLFTFLMAFLAIAGNAVWAQGKVHGSLQEPIDISGYDDAYLIDLVEEGTWYLTTKGEVNTYGIKVGGSRNAGDPADVKIYLTASAEIRAERRLKELLEKGQQVTYDEVYRDMVKRDYDDMHREIAPLKKAEDAVTADTSALDFDKSVELILEIVKRETEKQ